MPGNRRAAAGGTSGDWFRDASVAALLADSEAGWAEVPGLARGEGSASAGRRPLTVWPEPTRLSPGRLEPQGDERTVKCMEPDLRARVRAGDSDAFGMLFDQYAHAVYNLGFRLTANWSAAEEVVSLTFLEAWRKRGRIEPGGESLRPWLLGIAVNVSRNLARASRRQGCWMPIRHSCPGAGWPKTARSPPPETRAAAAPARRRTSRARSTAQIRRRTGSG